MDRQQASNFDQPVAPAPRQSRFWQAAAILLSLPAAAGCLLTAALATCVAVGVTVAIINQAEVKQIEPVVDEFMTAMAARDARGAYALLSTRARRSVSRSDLETMLEGSSFGLYARYQGIDVLESFVGFNRDTDESAPQGRVAQVSGAIYYADGFTGSFEAVLEREGDVWRLHGIQVTVPPDKLNDGRSLRGSGGVGSSGVECKTCTGQGGQGGRPGS